MAERKWVWAHLLFSLMAFVLLRFLQVLVVIFAQYTYRDTSYDSLYPLINKIEFYSYWTCVAIGHIFFILAIVRSLSYKNSLTTPNANDFLNDL